MSFSLRLWFAKFVIYISVVTIYLLVFLIGQWGEISWFLSLILGVFTILVVFMLLEGFLGLVGQLASSMLSESMNRVRKPTLYLLYLLFSLFVNAALFQSYSLSIESYPYVVGVIVLFALYLVSETKLEEEHIDKKGLVLLAWFIAGSVSGALFTAVAIIIFAYLGISVAQSILIFTAILTGGLTASISVLGRTERIGSIPPYITMYSELVAHLGKDYSHLLDDITDIDKTENEPIDYIDAREIIERNIPVGMISLAFSIFLITMLVSSINSQIVSGNYDILSNLIIIGATLFLLFIFYLSLGGSVEVYRKYHRWRLIWARLWNTVKLLSMGKAAAVLETVYEASISVQFLLNIFPDDKKQHVQTILEKYHITEAIPTDTIEFNQFFTNALLFDLCKGLLEDATELDKSLEAEFKLQHRAELLLSEVVSFSSPESRSLLGEAILYSSILEDADLPNLKLMYRETLFKQGLQGNGTLFQLSVNQLQAVEDMPKRPIPDSLKWFPAIYAVALWVTSIFLG